MQWTIYKASTEWGVDRKSLAKWLTMQGHEVKPGKKFHTRDISRAVMGDLEFERARLTRADADIREMERAQKREELIPAPEVQAMFNQALLPVRQRLLALPAECCVRCNPTDPTFSRSALQTWVDQALPAIRSELPKPRKS